MSRLDDVKQYSAGLGTYAGTRLCTLEDGVERGQRVLEMRSGGGLDVDIMVDRSGDVGRLSLAGSTLSWHGVGGLPSPWLINADSDRGQGFLRGFGGFLNTCGLDHIRQPETDTAIYAEHEALVEIDYPLHGRGALHPATLRGHGMVDEDSAQQIIFCETEYVQAMPFTSALRLRRRVEMPFGDQIIRINDKVRNVGNGDAVHMMLYHFNLGFPLVRPGMQLDLADDRCIWQSETHDALAEFGTPDAASNHSLSTFQHREDQSVIRLSHADDGTALTLTYPTDTLPFCQILRMQRPGSYGLAIEPCTTSARTRKQARDTGQLVILQPGEERNYQLELRFETATIDGAWT